MVIGVMVLMRGARNGTLYKLWRRINTSIVLEVNEISLSRQCNHVMAIDDWDTLGRKVFALCKVWSMTFLIACLALTSITLCVWLTKSSEFFVGCS